jgi:Gpi18-like mannosyltransferase
MNQKNNNNPTNSLARFKTSKFTRGIGAVLIVVLLALGIWLRMRGLTYVTSDMRDFLFRWYDIILRRGGFMALKDTAFSNYTPPYLYLIALSTYIPAIPKIIAIKSFSVVFDVVCAVTVFFIMRVMHGKFLSWAAAIAVFLAPSVWVDSAWWGQCDSIYTAFLLLSLLFLLKRKPWAAMVLYTVAFSFKLQAIFLAPFILLMLISRKIPWKTLVVVPVVLCLMMLPTLIAGQSLLKSLNIYLTQIDTFNRLSMNAPSIFAFFPNQRMSQFAFIGFMAAGTFTLAYLGLGWSRRNELTSQRMLLLAAISLLMLPLLLPRMHERYFYPAAIVAILAVSNIWYGMIALAVQFATVFSYAPYLLHKNLLPMSWLTIINLASLLVLIAFCFLSFIRSDPPES